MSKGGYTGKILKVDLTDGKIEVLRTREYFDINLFIGGKGLAAYVLWKEMKRGVDPFSEENLLVFSTGPLTGTLCPGTRICIATKSPLTGLFCDSYVGGHLGAEMKMAGYDAIVIKGRSERPVYIWIHDEHVEICSAEHIWGLDTFRTEEAIRKERKDETIRVACIGPAGERLVRFAHINVDRYRQAGRGGTGAVMGSKNLKALAVKGEGAIPVYDVEEFTEKAKEAHRAVLKNETVKARKRWGTARTIIFTADQDLLPTRNFREATFEWAENLSAEVLERKFWIKHRACHSCPVNCGKLGVVRAGKYAGTVVEGIEYETLALIGANCGIGSYEAVAYANMLCDMLGLDTISTGNVIAFAMECFERGILTDKDTEGLKLNFGNEEAVIRLIEKIAKREGLGNLLADGVKRFSEKIDEKSKSFAMHVKGLELPGYDARASPGMGLAYITADRGGCHTRAWPISYEISGKAPDGTVIGRYSSEKRAFMVKKQQDENTAYDTLVACWFLKGAVGSKRYVDMLNAAVGTKFTVEEFLSVGERIWNLVRLFNIREGLRKEDEILPDRIFADPIPSGIAKGQKLERGMLQRMLEEYYMIRGWSSEGIPEKEKIRQLKLDSIINLRLDEICR